MAAFAGAVNACRALAGIVAVSAILGITLYVRFADDIALGVVTAFLVSVQAKVPANTIVAGWLREVAHFRAGFVAIPAV